MKDSIPLNDYTLSNEYEEYKAKPFYKKKRYAISFLLVAILLTSFLLFFFSQKNRASRQADAITKKIEKITYPSSSYLSFASSSSSLSSSSLPSLPLSPIRCEPIFALSNDRLTPKEKNDIIAYIIDSVNITSLLKEVEKSQFITCSNGDYYSKQAEIISACFEGAIRSPKSEIFFAEIRNAFPSYQFSEDDLILAICLKSDHFAEMIKYFNIESSQRRSTYGMSAFGYYTFNRMNFSQNYDNLLKSKYPSLFIFRDGLGISVDEYIGMSAI